MAEQNKCSGCRYWAEFLASKKPDGTRQAVCVNALPANYNASTSEHENCPQWREALPPPPTASMRY